MGQPHAVITDPDNSFSNPRDLALEAAATLAAILDLRKERTLANQQFTVRRKKLEKRAEELIDTIRTGPDNQLKIHFGSAVALANTAPEDETFESDDPDPSDDELLPQDEPSEPSETELADEAEALQ